MRKLRLMILPLFGIVLGLLLFSSPAKAEPWVKCDDQSRPRFSSQTGGSIIYTCSPATTFMDDAGANAKGPNYYNLGVTCANGSSRQNFVGVPADTDVRVDCSPIGSPVTDPDAGFATGTIATFNRRPIKATPDDVPDPAPPGGGGGGTTAGFGGDCDLPATKFGLPTWYKYLKGQTDPAGNCRLLTEFNLRSINTFLSVGLAIVELLLSIAGIVAVVFIVVAGFRYTLSRGKPDETAKAQESIINALVGLVIAILAATLVRFIAKKLST